MTLSVDVRKRLGSVEIQARFEASGGVTALFGASGSGKTTLINIIGGLLRPDEGRVAVGGRVLVDCAAGVFVPPQRRRVGTVFQDARLFPHLTVAQNLRYGRFFTPAGERYSDFGAIVEMLGISALLARRPASLSGGEKQRVAIGRALLSSPRLILMDEPLAALDDARKAEILPYVERLRDTLKIPIVYVSHSIAEVARLATEIAVLEKGRMTAFGAAAGIVGRLDLLPAAERGEGGSLLEMTVARRDEAFAMTVLRSAVGELRVAGLLAEPGGTVRVRVRARDVMIATRHPVGLSALNVLPGIVARIGEDGGPYADVVLDCNGQEVAARITRKSRQELGLAPGTAAFAVVKAVSVEDGAGHGRSDAL